MALAIRVLAAALLLVLAASVKTEVVPFVLIGLTVAIAPAILSAAPHRGGALTIIAVTAFAGAALVVGSETLSNFFSEDATPSASLQPSSPTITPTPPRSPAPTPAPSPTLAPTPPRTPAPTFFPTALPTRPVGLPTQRPAPAPLPAAPQQQAIATPGVPLTVPVRFTLRADFVADPERWEISYRVHLPNQGRDQIVKELMDFGWRFAERREDQQIFEKTQIVGVRSKAFPILTTNKLKISSVSLASWILEPDPSSVLDFHVPYHIVAGVTPDATHEREGDQEVRQVVLKFGEARDRIVAYDVVGTPWRNAVAAWIGEQLIWFFGLIVTAAAATLSSFIRDKTKDVIQFALQWLLSKFRGPRPQPAPHAP